MPRYLFRDQYPLRPPAGEYTVIPASAYDRLGYARNWFPEQFAWRSASTYVRQEVPEPYGLAEQSVPSNAVTG